MGWPEVIHDVVVVLGTVVLHVVLGFVLGAVKDRTTAPQSLLWWCLSLACLPFGVVVPLRAIPNPFSLSRVTGFVAVGLLSSFVGQTFGRACRAIGLTGGIATGKSTVAQIYRDHRIPVIDADQIAHEIMRPGTATYARVVRVFGVGILQDTTNEGGGRAPIDRQALGKLVFDDPEKRHTLNRLTHPPILWQILRQLLIYRIVQGQPVVILDAPLLYESQVLAWLCSPIIVVSCAPALERERLMARDAHLSEREARQRLDSQMPLEEKVRRADLVLDNSETKGQLRHQALVTLRLALALVGQCRRPFSPLASPTAPPRTGTPDRYNKPPTPTTAASRRNVI